MNKAAAELERITPRNTELLKLADRFPAPQEWYDEDFGGLFTTTVMNDVGEIFFNKGRR